MACIQLCMHEWMLTVCISLYCEKHKHACMHAYASHAVEKFHLTGAIGKCMHAVLDYNSFCACNNLFVACMIDVSSF